MKKLHFINAPCHQSSREQGFQFAPEEIKQSYDYVITKNLFTQSKIDLTSSTIELCDGYNLLYNYVLNYSKNNPDDIIITIGGDNSISAGTVAGMNEKYLKQFGLRCESDLMVLWIDAFPDMYDFNTSVTKDLHEMSVASLLGLCENYFTKNKLLLKPSQFIYYGLLDENDNIDLVKDNKIPYFTTNKIKYLGVNTMIDVIKNMIGDKPLHVVIDMKVFNNKLIKSTLPTNENGLELEQVEKLLYGVRNNIVAMDITEFNPCIGTPEDVRITRETIRYLMAKVFDIKEKKINIFNEDSQFIIYRSVNQIDIDTDIGWYILRGISINDKEELIKLIPNDTIISIDIDANEEDNILELDTGTYLITKTTINEQNEKSYYTANMISDAVLFPQEKVLMAFELLSTYNE